MNSPPHGGRQDGLTPTTTLHTTLDLGIPTGHTNEPVSTQGFPLPARDQDQEVTVSAPQIDFEAVRNMCRIDKIDQSVDLSPQAFMAHRKVNWPTANVCHDEPHSQYINIYNAVKATGLPNCMGARRQVPSALNISAWEKYIDHDSDEYDILEYIKFGFPLGYMGPISNTQGISNHPSASNYKLDVDKFVKTELDLHAIVGPLNSTPFAPWSHVSPIMTRPKSDSSKRRVITDLTFPENKSINAYIFKNTAMGDVRDHTLPTVADLVNAIRDAPVGCRMFTIDISRAYRNFRADPLDWPLLCIEWQGLHYIDVSMPFGARASSCHMQRVANIIIRLLANEGILGFMYLDDLIVLSPDESSSWKHYHRARHLLEELGLPEAEDKSQPPAPAVRWLGIDIDTTAMTLSIPTDKVNDILTVVDRYRHCKSITRQQLQSLIGKLMHLAKCVEPARAFMSRILDTLRDMGHAHYTRVNDQMRADLAWFWEFATSWNGVSIIPTGPPTRVIQVDACLTGIGATDGRLAYAG